MYSVSTHQQPVTWIAIHSSLSDSAWASSAAWMRAPRRRCRPSHCYSDRSDPETNKIVR